MMNKPDWWFDEFRHFAVNFDDPDQVAAYDARQGTKLEEERALVQQLGIAGKQRVVELGTGTGAFALAAAEAGAQVIAVDISPAMLDYARNRASLSGLSEQITFIQAGFLSYEHYAQPADFVVTKYAFHHLPDFWKGIALSRIAAVLSPGGTFYLEDVVFSFNPAEAQVHLENWITHVADGQSFSRADFAGHIREEFSTWGWVLEGLLKQAGLNIVQRNYPSPTYAQYRCIKAYS